MQQHVSLDQLVVDYLLLLFNSVYLTACSGLWVYNTLKHTFSFTIQSCKVTTHTVDATWTAISHDGAQ